MSKKIKQSDTVGYKEGYRTGLARGYKQGIEAALRIVSSLLEDNGVHMEESEFYLEMQNLKDEGHIFEPKE